MIAVQRFGILSLAALVAVLAVWGAPLSVEASVGQWSQPTTLSRGRHGNWFPTVAADDNGNVHVLYSGYHNTEPPLDIAALWYTRTRGGSWTEPTDIALITEGAAARNAMAADASGRLFTAYKGWGSSERPVDFDPPRSLGPEDLWFTATRSTDGGAVQAWQPSRRISVSSLAYYSDIAVDSRGVIHLIWTESDVPGRSDSRVEWGLYYTSSADGGMTWSERQALDSNNFVWWYRAHLEVDATDRLHVTYEVTDREHLGRTRAAFYLLSPDGGRTWSRRQMGGQAGSASNDAGGPQAPSVGVDGNGTILFVYRELDTNQVLYRVSPDGVRWSPQQPLPGLRSGVYRPYDIYDMATDGAGHVHLVFVAYPQGSSTISLLHSEWDGEAWTQPDIVAADGFPEYPKLAIGGGNRLHVVWFSGDRDTVDRTPRQILYSTTTSSAPRTLTSALPVPIPTVSPAREVLTRPVPQSHRDVPPAAPATALSAPARSDQTSEVPPSLPLLIALVGAAAVITVAALARVAWERSRRGGF